MKIITVIKLKELAKIKYLFIKQYERSSCLQHEFQELKRKRDRRIAAFT